MIETQATRRFRLRTKSLYLTYPQCSVTPETCMREILLYFAQNELEWAVVGTEKHQDGSDHLHCAIKLKIAYETYHADCLDLLVGKHGNYQSARNLPKVVQYCIKDGNYVEENIDAVQYLDLIRRKKSSKAAIIAKHIIEDDKTVHELVLEFPGYALMHLGKMQTFKQYADLYRCEDKEEWGGAYVDYTGNVDDVSVANWLNLNIKSERCFKQTQLYIKANSGLGKTHLINELEKKLRIYYLPNEKYYDHYEDGCYDLIVLDEFKGQTSITFLNKLLEGSTMPIPKKGAQTVKRDNLPVMILSQYTLEEAYGSAMDYQARMAINNRTLVIQPSVRFNIHIHNKIDYDVLTGNVIDIDQLTESHSWDQFDETAEIMLQMEDPTVGVVPTNASQTEVHRLQQQRKQLNENGNWGRIDECDYFMDLTDEPYTGGDFDVFCEKMREEDYYGNSNFY